MSERLIVSLVFLTSVVMNGCAGWKHTLQPPTMAETREERAIDAVRSFEERRDSAQLEAALDRWKQGDVSRAEAMLSALVNRRPDYADARVHLAEVLWSRNDAAAEEHLRAVLETNTQRADAHHALGLVLDGTGRSEEARQHLNKAAELEPQNEIYQATSESLAERE